ncbi:hypothetical protein [Pacificoceanicola onchidii]|uniref:hypothetical protein n=1 Tax=Pacificoceanicola onchidii TaxID=2562685 RepID=UPI0010A4BD39|nr:hypothetical protein [Pacificoceanicola onchidii]
MTLTRSLRPKPRPETPSFKAQRSRVVPSAPTPRSVRSHATQETTLPRFEPVLLGVFGQENAQRALVRLPDGHVAELIVGSRLGAQQVIGVMPDALILSNSTRLHMPR